MSFRTPLILLAILAALGGFVYFYEVQGGADRARREGLAGQVIPVEKDSIVAVELARGDSSILLRREDGRWLIAEPVQAGVDEYTINNLVSAFQYKTERELEDTTGSDLSRYGLDEPAVRLRIEVATGDSFRLSLGDQSVTKSYRYALRDGQIILVPHLVFSNTNKGLFDLRDKRLLEFEPDQVRKVDLTVAGERYVLEGGQGTWRLTHPIEDRADKAAVTAIFNRVRNSRAQGVEAEEPVDLAAYGLDPPRAALKLTLADGTTRGLLVSEPMTVKEGDEEKERVRVKDQNRSPVFLTETALLEGVTSELFDLRYKSLAEFDAGGVVGYTVEGPDGRYTFVEDSLSVWRMVHPDTAEVRGYRLRSTFDALQRLRGTKLVAEEGRALDRYGLEKPTSLVRLRLDGGRVEEILFGKETDDGVYAKNRLSPKVFLVEKDILEKLKVDLEDLTVTR